MMEKAFAAAGLDWRYLTLEVTPEKLVAAVAGMKAMGFRGANFASPHQVNVVEHLDRLSESAQLSGAVNCVFVSEDEYVGENTDGKGFVAALRNVMDPSEKRIAIMGAGGTARAIAVELANAGVAAVTVANRTVDRGQALVELLNERTEVAATLSDWDGDWVIPEDTELLVNATAIGLRDAAARVPINTSSFSDRLVVADVVHNPPRTLLLCDAAEHGCITLDGLAMLVSQAIIDFKIWTGVDADANVMQESLEEYFEL